MTKDAFMEITRKIEASNPEEYRYVDLHTTSGAVIQTEIPGFIYTENTFTTWFFDGEMDRLETIPYKNIDKIDW